MATLTSYYAKELGPAWMMNDNHPHHTEATLDQPAYPLLTTDQPQTHGHNSLRSVELYLTEPTDPIDLCTTFEP